MTTAGRKYGFVDIIITVKFIFLNYLKWPRCASILVGARSKSGATKCLFIFKTANIVSFHALHFQSLLCLLHWRMETTSIFPQKWSWSLAWMMKLVCLTCNDSALLHQRRCLPLSIGHLTRIEVPCLVRFFVPIHGI